MLYWKKMLSECGVDWTDIERVCSDRDGWKKCVSERMRHLDKWERQQGHRYDWGPNERMIERNDRRVIDLVCKYEGCGKVCKSKGGLTLHQKRIHRPPEERVRFECRECGVACETEVACMMYERTCAGGGVGGSRRECDVCKVWISRANYARHVRACGGREGETLVGGEAGEGDQGEGGRVPEVWECGVILQYGEAPEELQGVGPWRWVKPLTGADGP